MEGEGKGNGGPTYKEREVKGGRGKWRGRAPPVITVSTGSKGARIVTDYNIVKLIFVSCST